MARKSTVTQSDAEAPAPEPAWYQHVGWWADEPWERTNLDRLLSARDVEWAVIPGWMLPIIRRGVESFDQPVLGTDLLNESEVVAKETGPNGDMASLARELLVELVRAKQVVSDQFVEQAWSAAEKFTERARRIAEVER